VSLQLTAEFKGLTELAKDLGDAQRATAPELHKAMETSLLLIERDARSHVRQDTRALMGSISHSIKQRGSSIEGKVGPSKDYGYFVEYGRKPGKQPPIAAVEGWARRHGISPFLVARAIGRKGTKAKPFMAPALEKNERRIHDLFDDAGAKVIAVVGGR
jgi:hypothetical protein